ncbi:MAG: uroporphyrinogen-III synthase [Bacteroidetes bacterium]|nr:uroporphyrinogen-III synthase [Bacteroidota bacterium]
MQQNKPRILITAEIDNSLLEKLTAKGFEVEVLNFIKTTTKQSLSLRQQIKNIPEKKVTVIFTSSKAVEAVDSILQNKKTGWNIYCVGKATKNLITQLFPGSTILGFANYATELAKEIINDNKADEVYFFCGNKRRNDLPDLLKENNIGLHEIEVYETVIYQHEVKKNFDAVIFFSPSAVEGFFAVNTIIQSTVFFAIGKTTADAIKKFSGNKIILSDTPGKKELIEEVAGYFTK